MIKSTIEQLLTDDFAEIWRLLSTDEKHLLAENFTIHHYRKNQVIYAEKEEPEFLWCLIEGKVKKYKDGIGGRCQIIRLIKPIEYFGYRAYFAGEHYVSSAATLEPSTLATIPMAGRQVYRSESEPWRSPEPRQPRKLLRSGIQRS